jgi:hypothetical protein
MYKKAYIFNSLSGKEQGEELVVLDMQGAFKIGKKSTRKMRG